MPSAIAARSWPLVLFATVSCQADRPADAGAGGLATRIDSTADSVFARTSGAPPVSSVRALIAEVRIAPTADDTSLFTEVSEVDIDAAGRFWVFDRPSSSLFLFDAAGRLLRRIGRRGGGPGEFGSSSGMVALPDTGLAVWDPGNGRISFFDATGSFRTSWLTPTGFNTSNGLVADRGGGLYLRRPVTPPREGEILGRMGLVRLSTTGEFADSLAPPDIDVPREVYVASRKQGKNNFSQSSTSSSYAPTYHWAWHPSGHFVVAHGGRFEIISTPASAGGRPLVIRRELPPVEIPSAERDEEQASITYNLRRTDPGWTWSGPALPTTKAPLLGITVTRDGRIWARIAAPSERIPDDEVTPSNDPKAPVGHYRTPVVYEVFGEDGRFLGRVDCRCRMTLVESDGDRVWAIVRDELDLPAVVRFRIDPGLR